MKQIILLNIFFVLFFINTNTLFGMHKSYADKFAKLLEELQRPYDDTAKKELLNNFIQQHDFKVNFQNEQGQTLLHIAAALGLKDIVNELLIKKANQSIQDSRGNTFLHILLIKDPKTFAKRFNIFSTFLQQNNEEIIKPLINMQDKTSKVTPFQLLIESANNFGSTTIDILINTIKQALEKGANPNLQNNHGDTALILAFKNDFPEIVPFLIQHGANLYLKTKDGKNIFHIAAENNNPELLKIIFETIKDPLIIKNMINAQDSFGNTPLYLAISKNNKSLETSLSLLILGAADPNKFNKSGFTPLHNAISIKNKNLITALLKYGANPLLRTIKKTEKKQYNPNEKKYDVVEIIEEDQDTPLEMAEKMFSAEYNIKKSVIEALSQQGKINEALKVAETLDLFKEITNLLQKESYKFPAPVKKELQPRITKITPQPQKPTPQAIQPKKEAETMLKRSLEELIKKLESLTSKLSA